MGISYDEFQNLPVWDQRHHVQDHEYFMGLKRTDGRNDPIGHGPALIDFYENILHRPLNGARPIMGTLRFNNRYRNCLGCGKLYEEDPNREIIVKVCGEVSGRTHEEVSGRTHGEIIGKISSLSDEFNIFDIRPGFCAPECVEKLASREHDN